MLTLYLFKKILNYKNHNKHYHHHHLIHCYDRFTASPEFQWAIKINISPHTIILSSQTLKAAWFNHVFSSNNYQHQHPTQLSVSLTIIIELLYTLKERLFIREVSTEQTLIAINNYLNYVVNIKQMSYMTSTSHFITLYYIKN